MIDLTGQPICAAEVRCRGSKARSNLAGRFCLELPGEPLRNQDLGFFHEYPVVVTRRWR